MNTFAAIERQDARKMAIILNGCLKWAMPRCEGNEAYRRAFLEEAKAGDFAVRLRQLADEIEAAQ